MQMADGDVKLWRGLPWWRKEERADVCLPGPRKVKLSNENLTSQEAKWTPRYPGPVGVGTD